MHLSADCDGPGVDEFYALLAKFEPRRVGGRLRFREWEEAC